MTPEICESKTSKSLAFAAPFRSTPEPHMPTLREQILTEPIRPQLVRECTDLIDREVGGKRGLSGMAIKTAYKAIKTIKRGFVPSLVNFLVDEWVDQLEPYYASFLESDSADFVAYIGTCTPAVAESLLEVTDKRAATTKHRTAGRFYKKLRPNAKGNVIDAVPSLARIVQSHLTP